MAIPVMDLVENTAPMATQPTDPMENLAAMGTHATALRSTHIN